MLFSHVDQFNVSRCGQRRCLQVESRQRCPQIAAVTTKSSQDCCFLPSVRFYTQVNKKTLHTLLCKTKPSPALRERSFKPRAVIFTGDQFISLIINLCIVAVFADKLASPWQTAGDQSEGGFWCITVFHPTTASNQLPTSPGTQTFPCCPAFACMIRALAADFFSSHQSLASGTAQERSFFPDGQRLPAVADCSLGLCY